MPYAVQAAALQLAACNNWFRKLFLDLVTHWATCCCPVGHVNIQSRTPPSWRCHLCHLPPLVLSEHAEHNTMPCRMAAYIFGWICIMHDALVCNTTTQLLTLGDLINIGPLDQPSLATCQAMYSLISVEHASRSHNHYICATSVIECSSRRVTQPFPKIQGFNLSHLPTGSLPANLKY